MVVMRASQNGPYITARFECKDLVTYNIVKERVKAILKRRPEISWENGVNTGIFF